MSVNLSQYINKTIFVSVRTGPDAPPCVPYKLVSIELLGLWLDGANLEEHFITHKYPSGTSISWQFFVPFSQIACVAVATATAAVAEGSARTPTTATPQKRPKAKGS